MSTQDRSTTDRKNATGARLFDIRRVLGGLFVVYGVLIGIVGLADSPGQVAKAQGVRINLWGGLVMLAFGLLMLLWQWLSPVRPDREEEERRE
jgi:quinol-cytochrome oxidoreductase complex cytochrome b subunit